VPTEPNLVFNRVPIVVQAVMQTTEINAAMSPYSMAVAPDSFRIKALNVFVIICSSIVPR
jgi:hypothetical protein